MSAIVNDLAQLAIFWEDLPVGTTYTTSSRTITEGDVAAFAGAWAEATARRRAVA